MRAHEAELGCAELPKQSFALAAVEGVAKHDGASARLAPQHAQHAWWGLTAAARRVQQLMQVELHVSPCCLRGPGISSK